MDKNWKMPAVEAGDIVLFAVGDGGTTVPAVVTIAGDQAIDLLAFVPGSSTGDPRTGVRHETDPVRIRNNFREAWRHTPQTARLQARLTDLETLVSSPPKKG